MIQGLAVGIFDSRDIRREILTRTKSMRECPEVRHRVQSSDGFESVWDAAEIEARTGHPEALNRYQEIQRAVYKSFRAMNLALANRVDFNFSKDRRHAVNGFHARFDCIYTLNQDLLLELSLRPVT